MKEFYPWSKAVYDETIKKYLNGNFSVLDIQLSGKCNFNCVYCDSPDRNIKAQTDFKHLENLVREEKGKYDWMFVCGLGEPLYNENKVVLLQLLALCKDMGIKCSIFTNGSNMDELILSYVREGILYPIIKVDTFLPKLAQELYGSINACKTLKTIEDLLSIARGINDSVCHVAASIVPTTKNLDEIPYIVERCIEHSTFPLIGQLEYAGNAIGSYEDLLLTQEQLIELKEKVNSLIGMDYNVPICPAVISGIHVAINGYVTVDRKSGLSCSWFWLETPDVENICNFNKIKSFCEVEQKIREYRKKSIDQLFVLKKDIQEYPFGGCGGNVKDLFDDYLNIQSKLSV